jgi:hypothetical protein
LKQSKDTKEAENNNPASDHLLPLPRQSLAQRIPGLSRQASAALEQASQHSMASVLSPSVILRHHLGAGGLPFKAEAANHGSLGLYSENHGSAFSVIGNQGPGGKNY